MFIGFVRDVVKARAGALTPTVIRGFDAKPELAQASTLERA
jgi:hypothetical protein